VSATPSDPLLADQWHLAGNSPGTFDLNVLPAWELASGAGVTAYVLDDAFDYTHPDLQPNYDAASDWDYEDDDPNPFGTSGEAHGTATMGLLGAAADGQGAVGVAFDAGLVGYRLHGFIDNQFITQLTEALEDAAANGADVVSMSLGTQYIFNFYDQALSATLMQNLAAAIDQATAAGRGGLGSVLVKAAGNGGDDTPPSDANLASWNANYKVISVAAIDRDGDQSSYSTPGANLLVSGFGSPALGEVVTTDRQGAAGYVNADYFYEFNGTSAATPMVAGVVALMLEANPKLAWSEVQTILALTARRYDEEGDQVGDSGDWTWNDASSLNAGGFHFSEKFGFGLVDAASAVRLAKTWEADAASADLDSATVDGLDASLTVPDNNSAGLSIAFDGPGTIADIQFVELELTLSHTYVGDLQVFLTSPGGTTTQILDRAAGSANHPSSWTYTANAFRGENADGTWTLKIADLAGADVGRLSDVKLTAHGRSQAEDDLYVVTPEYSEVYADGGRNGTLADDDGGHDVINTAALETGVTLDLAGGAGMADGQPLHLFGIEDAMLGSGTDSLFGSSAANRAYGQAGDDHLSGGLGDDRFYGGDGMDRLAGGSGADSLRGQDGDDRLEGDSGADTLFAADGEDWAYGGAGGDRVGGGSGSDSLFGGNDRDRLNGGSGVDWAAGGSENDTFIVDTAMDVVLESAGGGIEDVLRSDALAFTLASGSDGFLERANVNRQVGDADLWGNDKDNTLLGASGDDRLAGFDGDDILNGGEGSDILVAGAGEDTFVVDTAGDDVRDFEGQGVDLVRALTDFTLPDGGPRDFIENLRLQGGAGSIDGTGNSLDNHLEGNTAANRLAGNQGVDRIEAGAGDDTVFGGGDGDTMAGESGADTLAIGKDDLVYGGSGQDWFLFRSGALTSGTQRIADLDGGDRLVFATGFETGTFAYIADGGFTASGNSEARLADPEVLEVDRDGDGLADYRMGVQGASSAGDLTASDFLWLV